MGKNVIILERDEDVDGICWSSLRGVMECFVVVSFKGSLEEGDGNGLWNYIISFDSVLG